jgi:predicted transcriptional regulator YheO
MELEELKRMAKLIAQMFSPNVETLIHDLQSPEKRILHIYNGQITGRKPGDATRLFHTLDDDMEHIEEVVNYEHSIKPGHILRASSMVFKEGDIPKYGFTINFDNSYLKEAARILYQLSDFKPPTDPDNAALVEQVTPELVKNELSRCLMANSFTLNNISGEEMKKIVEDMLKSGFIQRRKVVPILATLLGVSKPTVYNYIKAISD